MICQHSLHDSLADLVFILSCCSSGVLRDKRFVSILVDSLVDLELVFCKSLTQGVVLDEKFKDFISQGCGDHSMEFTPALHGSVYREVDKITHQSTFYL